MNSVSLVGRLTKDPEIRHTQGQQPMTVANFSLAIDRPVRAGQEKKTDYPRITVFGRQAESCEKYLAKGMRVGVTGRIQTDKYTNRDGVTVYTTYVIADRVEFLDYKNRNAQDGGNHEHDPGVPEGFQAVDDEDIPF